MRRGQPLPVGRTGFKRPLLLPASPIPIRRRELAWAAGFFDGEGSTFVTGKRIHPIVSITQAGVKAPPEVLLRFLVAVGGIGHVTGPVFERGYKPKWFYQAYGHEAVQAVVALLWHWLGEVKRAQATVALQRHREVPRGERNPGVRFGRPLNAVCKRGHDYSDVVLNSKGVRQCRPCRNLLSRLRMREVRRRKGIAPIESRWIRN